MEEYYKSTIKIAKGSARIRCLQRLMAFNTAEKYWGKLINNSNWIKKL